MANERAAALKNQFILDMHTHFLRDDTRLTSFVAMRSAVGKAGWNADLAGKEQTLDDLKFENYVKEIYLDSDTKIVQISSAPSDVLEDWFLTNQQMADARTKVNARFGSKRMFSHAIFTPGQPGWLEEVDAALELKPDAMKGYTIGDNTHKDLSRYPWRMDDEKTTYKAYEKFVKAGIKNVCVHKGLFALPLEKQYPNLRPFVDCSDVGKAAKDWPQLNFIIYHAGYRHVGGDPVLGEEEWEKTGRLSWVTDLAEIPAKYGVNNVYATRDRSSPSPLCHNRVLWRRSWARWSRVWAWIAYVGVRMPCGPVRRNGRSKVCVVWKFPKTCRRSLVSSRSVRRTVRSSAPFSAATMQGCTASIRPRPKPKCALTS